VSGKYGRGSQSECGKRESGKSVRKLGEEMVVERLDLIGEMIKMR